MKETQSEADAAEVAAAVMHLRAVVGRVRGKRGRDFVRGLPYGRMLDAFDSGRKDVAGTDRAAFLVDYMRRNPEDALIAAQDCKIAGPPQPFNGRGTSFRTCVCVC